MRLTRPTYQRPRAAPGRPRWAALAPAATALAALLLCASPRPGALAASPPPALVIEGAGDGHGVGMSQDGALGYAQHGSSYRQILAHYYTATTIGRAPARAVVRVLIGAKVKRIPLERYVRGVVAAEMPASWPLAALEAQAVASRTYALTAHAGGSRFDVYADTRSQVYLGVAAETSRTNAAVAATAGQIVLYAGRPATTYFFASSGGMTENVENAFLGSQPQPWLRAVADPYEAPQTARWRLTLSFRAAAGRLRGLINGSFRGIEVLSRGISPRILAAEVLGSRGVTQVSGPELAARLGLTSTWAYFSVKRGARLTREPDRSHRAPAPAPASAPPPPSAPAPAAPQGGATAPMTNGVTSARTGGLAAG